MNLERISYFYKLITKTIHFDHISEYSSSKIWIYIVRSSTAPILMVFSVTSWYSVTVLLHTFFQFTGKFWIGFGKSAVCNRDPMSRISMIIKLTSKWNSMFRFSWLIYQSLEFEILSNLEESRNDHLTKIGYLNQITTWLNSAPSAIITWN